MSVNHAQGGVFAAQVLAQRNQRGVFEDVGVVAGVKGVAVTEHGAIVTVGRPSKTVLDACLLHDHIGHSA